jgi:predicted CoA-binding protein
MTTTEILQHSHTVLLVDWPSRDVPETLVRSGFTVYVKGGPNPDDFFLHEWHDHQLVQQRIGHPPDHADLVYSYRPLAELPGVIELAKFVGARTIWTQSGRCSDGREDPRGCWLSDADRLAATCQIQSAGLHHITQPYIADAARQLTPAHS